MIPVRMILKPASTESSPVSGDSDNRGSGAIMWRFGTVAVAITAGAMFVFAPCRTAFAVQEVDKTQPTKVETNTHRLADAVERLQEDIVEELSGVKEKQIFQKADQVLLEIAKMEKLLKSNTAAREALYRQFDSIDGKVTALRKTASEFAAKYPVLQRDADRIRILTDDLQFAVSQGDISPERIREVLIRQAKAMSDVTKKLSRTAEYALGNASGRGELLADLQKLAQASGTFEKSVETHTDLETCRKEFSSLNEAWGRAVLGMSLLSPAENVSLLRGALRADAIHERLFRALKINGERTALTIRI